MPGAFLLGFLVRLMDTTVFTELNDLKTVLELLFVLMTVVVNPTTVRALEFYEIIL